MLDRKKLPIGVSEFRSLIENNYYYIDKTTMIEEILQTGAVVTLITRPRRFGKTLNMTMLREFFSMDVDSNEIFSGLNIMKTKYADEINKYPVLFFSFKDVKGDTTLSILGKVKSEILREYLNYQALSEKMTTFEKEDFLKMLIALRQQAENNSSLVDNSIKFLSEIIYKYHNVRPILLIDEYDTPMISSYENNCYDELRTFFSNLFSTALKDNPYLNFAVLTGIQRVAKENIFSGLNNLKVCTVMDERHNDKFGLTKEETAIFLRYYSLDLNEQVSAMYNGYNFAGEQIFNPWSIINYADTKRLEYFWVNTSSNKLIYDLFSKLDFDFADVFEQLVAAGKVTLSVDLATTFFEMQKEANFWGLLLNAGYLTLDKEAHILGMSSSYRIPNGEVREEFKKIAAIYIKQEPSSLEKMFTALLNKDTKTFASTYQKMLLKSISFYDRRETAYHMLFLGMSFYLYDRYDIKSTREVGDGRADIIYTAKHPNEPHLIVEIKHEDTDNEDALKKLALVAKEQIQTKNYYADLSGDILILGVAHSKKDVQVAAELIIKN